MSRTGLLSSQTVRGGDNRLLIWLIVAAIFLSSLLCVWSRAKVVSLGYEISRESKYLQTVEEANEKLRSEVAMLSSPGRLEIIAKTRLGLFPPKNHQIVLLK